MDWAGLERVPGFGGCVAFDFADASTVGGCFAEKVYDRRAVTRGFAATAVR
jgi:hypothetical protein